MNGMQTYVVSGAFASTTKGGAVGESECTHHHARTHTHAQNNSLSIPTGLCVQCRKEALLPGDSLCPL